MEHFLLIPGRDTSLEAPLGVGLGSEYPTSRKRFDHFSNNVGNVLLVLGHRSLIRNKTQTAVISILNLHISVDYDLTFRMYSTYVFKSNR